jgi:hypothetical protein
VTLPLVTAQTVASDVASEDAFSMKNTLRAPSILCRGFSHSVQARASGGRVRWRVQATSFGICCSINRKNRVLRARDLNLLANIRSVGRSRTKGGFWRIIKAPLGQLSCSPIRKQGLRNSGFRDVAAPRYHLSPHSFYPVRTGLFTDRRV